MLLINYLYLCDGDLAMKNDRTLEKYVQRAIDWTEQLVQIPSVNPPGREYEVACHCMEILQGMGIEADFDEYAPGRVNVTAYVGNREDIALILNGHLDVVPAPGAWRYDPFSGFNDGKRIWGRGASDMKSGCACMMAALNARLDYGEAGGRGICLALTADEELMGSGIRRMIDRHHPKADAAIIGEPTNLELCFGNRGYCSLYIRTKGVACHACEPENGVNAIYKMGHVITRLEAYAQEMRQNTNPQLGHATFSLGLISGGSSLNAVPAECEIVIESRGFPGMNVDTLARDLRSILPADVEIVPRSNLLASLVPMDSVILQKARQAYRQVHGKEAIVSSFPAWSEAGFYTEICQIPTILFGPGSIARAHRIDEYVEIQQIRDAVKVYDQILRMC